jgi:hypothetical protein
MNGAAAIESSSCERAPSHFCEAFFRVRVVEPDRLAMRVEKAHTGFEPVCKSAYYSAEVCIGVRLGRAHAASNEPFSIAYPQRMTIKERLHHIIEEMTDEEAEATLRRIEARRTDPLLRYLDAAPLDDEPLNPDEEAAVAEVEGGHAADVPTIPFDDVKRKYA